MLTEDSWEVTSILNLKAAEVRRELKSQPQREYFRTKAEADARKLKLQGLGRVACVTPVGTVRKVKGKARAVSSPTT